MAACPECGADNPDYAFYCGKCSAGLRDAAGNIIVPSSEAATTVPSKTGSSDVPQPVPRSGPPSSTQPRHCRWCGRPVSDMAQFCPYCGKNPRGPIWGSDSSDLRDWTTYDYNEPLEGHNASGTLVVGGVMAILAGLLALGQGLVLVGASSSLYGQFVSGSGAICFCGALDALFGLGSIAGGIFAIRQSSFGLALIGAIVGLLGVGFGIGALFGLVAIICIAVSRREFSD